MTVQEYDLVGDIHGHADAPLSESPSFTPQLIRPRQQRAEIDEKIPSGKISISG
jgi:hypothetical protein